MHASPSGMCEPPMKGFALSLALAEYLMPVQQHQVGQNLFNPPPPPWHKDSLSEH